MVINLEQMSIRPFAQTDKPLVIDFFAQMSGETRALFDRGSCNSRNALGFFEGKDAHVIRWLALYREEMIGYVFLWDTDKGVPWLGIAVAEVYKGQHLGQHLLDTAHKYAKEQGKGGVLLTTHVANLRGQGLYERCGYERLGMHTSGEILYLLRFK